MLSMAESNPFTPFPLARLLAMQEEYMQAIENIASTGGSYSINGRSFTSVDLDKLQETLVKVNDAITEAQGGVTGIQCAQAHVGAGWVGYGYGDVNRV